MTNLSDFDIKVFKEDDWTYYAEVLNFLVVLLTDTI